MNPIKIEYEKCTKCLSCINDCPNSYLFIEEDKVKTHDTGCMECGHCYAICPTNAIQMTNYENIDEKIVAMTEINSDTLLKAVKSRRSILSG